MMNFLKWGLLVHVSVLLMACANSGNTSGIANDRPFWIENPGNGVSSSAGMHIGGRVAQEELAILRGREEYAKRFGVNIQSEQLVSTTVVNDKSSTVANKVTYEESKKADIKVMVKEKWREPGSDVLWVWLVPSDQ